MAVEHVIRHYVCESFVALPVAYLLIFVTQVVHLLFCWSSFLSWTLLIIDLMLIGFLGMHAYQDGESDSKQYLPVALIRYLILITHL